MTYYVNTDIHPFTRQYLKATPWEDPEIYAKTSPITYIKGAKAPTLIQHGATDQRVPLPNAYELYQGLQDVRVCRTKLIVYKGFEGVGHGPSKPKSSRAVMQHNLEWFDEYHLARVAAHGHRSAPLALGSAARPRLAREPLGGTLTRTLGHFLAVAGGGRCNQRVDESSGYFRHVLDGAVEGRLVGLRRFGEAAQLPDELQRRRANLLIGRGRIEVEQGFDVPTHAPTLRHPGPRAGDVMSRLALSVSCVLASAVLLGAQAPPLGDAVRPFVSVDAPVVALTHARVIDGTGAPARPIRRSRSRTERSPRSARRGQVAIPEGATTIDLAGKSVMPGSRDGARAPVSIRPVPASTGSSAPASSRLYLAGGVTTMRTGGNMNGVMDLNLKRQIDAAQQPGPSIDATAPYLNGPQNQFCRCTR